MIVTRFRGLAREYAIAILGSFRERSLPKPRNTCIVLDHYGEEIASYSKCHLFTPADEDKGVSASRRRSVSVRCFSPALRQRARKRICR